MKVRLDRFSAVEKISDSEIVFISFIKRLLSQKKFAFPEMNLLDSS